MKLPLLKGNDSQAQPFQLKQLDLKEQARLKKSIENYKQKLHIQKQFDDKKLTEKDLLERDVKDGKYPDLLKGRLNL